LNDAIPVALYITGDGNGFRFKSNAAEINDIAFVDHNAEYSLIIRIGAAILVTYFNGNSRQTPETVGRHHYTIQLYNGIICWNLLSLACFREKAAYKNEKNDKLIHCPKIKMIYYLFIQQKNDACV
jgi:hypothetical protein